MKLFELATEQDAKRLIRLVLIALTGLYPELKWKNHELDQETGEIFQYGWLATYDDRWPGGMLKLKAIQVYLSKRYRPIAAGATRPASQRPDMYEVRVMIYKHDFWEFLERAGYEADKSFPNPGSLQRARMGERFLELTNNVRVSLTSDCLFFHLI